LDFLAFFLPAFLAFFLATINLLQGFAAGEYLCDVPPVAFILPESQRFNLWERRRVRRRRSLVAC
jgi:hypothetical protein